jgi:hypothetical protein
MVFLVQLLEGLEELARNSMLLVEVYGALSGLVTNDLRDG